MCMGVAWRRAGVGCGAAAQGRSQGLCWCATAAQGWSMGPRRGAAWGFAGALHVTEQGRSMWLRKGTTWGWAGAHRLRKGRSVWLRWDAVRDRAGGLHRAAQGCSVGPRRGAQCGCIGAQPGARRGRSCCARGAAWGRELVRPAAARKRFVGLRCAVWGRTGRSVELRTSTALGCARGAARSRGVRLRKVRRVGPRTGAPCGGARGAAWGCAGAQHAAAQRVKHVAALGRSAGLRGTEQGAAWICAWAQRGAAHGAQRGAAACGCARGAMRGGAGARHAAAQRANAQGRNYAGGSGLQGRLTTGFRHPCSATSATPGGCWRRAVARQRGTPHHRAFGDTRTPRAPHQGDVGVWLLGPASPQAFGREGGGWREEGAPHPGLLAPSPNVCSSSQGGGVSSPQAVGAPDASVGSAGPPHPRLSAAPAVGGGGGLLDL